METLSTLKKVSLSAAVIAVLFSCQKKDAIDKVLPTISSESVAAGKHKIGNLNGGLIAYWPLDGCVNTNDVSGNGHHGTPNNTTLTTDRFGTANGAFYFNGTNSYIDVEDDVDLRLTNTDFTLSAWVKLDSYNAASGSHILTKRSDNPYGYIFSVRGSTTAVPGVSFFGPGGNYINAFGTKVITTGSWHLVTAVYRLGQRQLSLYVDGILDNTSAGLSPLDAPEAAKLYIGRDEITSSSTNGAFFHGALDDIRIYNRALTGGEIQELYGKTIAPAAGLIAYWPLDYCRNARDLSGNGNHGTVSNTSLTTDRFGNVSGAFYFNGTNSYIAVADKPALRLTNTDFTVSAWVKLDGYNVSWGSGILGKRNDSPFGYGFSVTGTAGGPAGTGVPFFGPGGGYVNGVGTKVINLGSWHHLTAVYSYANQQLSHYVDGVLDNTTSGVLPANAPATAKLYIGRDEITSPTNGYFFYGTLDDIRMYNRTLTPGEIQNLYNAVN
ncbi:LamG domain-containing protein [Chitinophaga nivalis]|uniref:LamG domain-containing protein n=1 Tax=Chitinophaga nivalis TaxID=2991709 RepID=A0ABT3ITJ8_9BACT|nr:LamG domain-containing protein [Chitinophaga nivalis]MCW3462993.1 LamG domain-containing protein [Chitinophaga nivalis]MCW3487317.1 LamG domain-containing protein [Chitinophaga nivalis]